MTPAWQIAVAVLCGFLCGALFAYLVCCFTVKASRERRPSTEAMVGADADGQATGAPQGRPQPTTPGPREQHDEEA